MTLNASYTALTKDVVSLDFTETDHHCELLLTGDTAFPVLVSTSGQVLIAASQYGKGRIVAVAHEIYLHRPQFSKFLQNAINWLKPSADALVGVQSKVDSLIKTFADHGIKMQSSSSFSKSFQVYCMDAYDDNNKSELIAFVKNGGGLLIAGEAGQWATKNGKEKVCFDFPGNQVINVSGIYFTPNYVTKGIFSVSKEVPTVPLLVDHGIDPSKELELLLNGVSELNITSNGTPSRLLVHGSLAFPVGWDNCSRSFLAAAYYGKGRVVVVTNKSQLQSTQLEAFLLKAVSWLSNGRNGDIGIGGDWKQLKDILSKNKVSCGLSDLKPTLSVYCCDSQSDREAKEIHEFVAEGGGLLIGGEAWHWANDNPRRDAVAEYPGNKILNTFGICILGKALLAFEGYTVYKLVWPKGAQKPYHFRSALSQFLQDSSSTQDLNATQQNWLCKLGLDCAELVKTPAEESAVVLSIHRVLNDLMNNAEVPQASKKMPIKCNSRNGMLIQLATSHYEKHHGPGEPYHAPSPASDFPPVSLSIDGNNKGLTAWRSTGLYVQPKQTAALTFPSAALGVGLLVQIGCQTDDLSDKKEFYRPPVAIRVYEVKSKKMTISSLWGGLLYILIPAKCQLGSVSITVEGAVRAPFYKHGETSESDWMETIRNYPGPWAEFATKNIILTVPADNNARTVQNPGELMSLWDRIMKAIAELAAIPADFLRPERIVADVQISAGLMHNGYPVMCLWTSVSDLIDIKHITNSGSWGPFHELGHNQQRPGWEISPNTTEATCNLWSVYVSETVLGKTRSEAHKDLEPEERSAKITNYMKKGAMLKDWTCWTALETYLQLQECFGWEPFIKLFAKYQTIGNIKDDNTYKMNLWAENFSKQVNMNLAPFFMKWGWPISDDVVKRLASLPKWVKNPMTKYV